MEREREIAKLVNVLRRTARMAMQSEWTGGAQDTAAFCIGQYNRVLERLKEIDPDLAPIFQPLAENSSLGVAAMACRQLSAYYEDEVGGGGGHQHRWRGYGIGFDPEAFREFWCKSARDIEDLGEYIRESVDEWVRQKRGRRREEPTAEEQKS